MGAPKYTKEMFVDSFWKRVDKTESGCWEWIGAKRPDGYGQAYYSGKLHRTHRVSFELSGRHVPEGMQLDHLCRNRGCCNPDHLEAVTSAENTRRGVIGEIMRARAKLVTHCPKGHPYSPENTYRTPSNNSRKCIICMKAREASRVRPKIGKSGSYERG